MPRSTPTGARRTRPSGGLERAYKQGDGGLSNMKGDPLLRSLERDLRYTAFLKKMKLPV